jgi:hypothetical protein
MTFHGHPPRTRVVLVGDVEGNVAYGDDDGVDPIVRHSPPKSEMSELPEKKAVPSLLYTKRETTHQKVSYPNVI